MTKSEANRIWMEAERALSRLGKKSRSKEYAEAMARCEAARRAYHEAEEAEGIVPEWYPERDPPAANPVILHAIPDIEYETPELDTEELAI